MLMVQQFIDKRLEECNFIYKSKKHMQKMDQRPLEAEEWMSGNNVDQRDC